MRHWKPLTALLVVIAVMQVGLALRHSLWADEVFSLAMATGHSVEHPAVAADPSKGDFVEQTSPVSAADLRRYTEFDPASGGSVIRAVKLSDTSPPLYYLLLSGWTRVWGVGDLALRMFSIVCALACVPLVIAIGRKVESEKAGWIAGVLFAMAPVAVYYSSEGRMYSLLWLCVLVTAYATIALYRGARYTWQIGWVLAAAAGLLVHYYFVFPFVALGVFSLWTPGSDRRWQILVRGAAVALLVFPWYKDFGSSLQQWRITQDWVKWRPDDYNQAIVLRNLVTQYFSGYGHYLWDLHRYAQMGAVALFGAAGVFALWKSRVRLFAGSRLMLWLWFGAACLGPWIADQVRHTYVAPYTRYTSTALPAACLLGGMMLGHLRAPMAWSGVLLIGLCWAPNVASIYRSRSRSAQQMADMARHVGTYGQADDLILVHSIPTGAIALARYAQGPAAFATWVGQLGQRRVPSSLLELLADRRRVFLVKVHTVGEPAPEEGWLRENAVVVKEKQLAGAEIVEFKPRGAERF
jgi:4-amino-4-deoxy-L-arabinose transferase-like glycosyltransferase